MKANYQAHASHHNLYESTQYENGIFIVAAWRAQQRALVAKSIVIIGGSYYENRHQINLIFLSIEPGASERSPHRRRNAALEDALTVRGDTFSPARIVADAAST